MKQGGDATVSTPVAMAKNNGWGSSTDGNQHSTSGSFRTGKAKKGGCDLIAAPVAAGIVAFLMWRWKR